MSSFVQLLTDSIASGCIYGSLALGFVLTYRTCRQVNFAQAEIAMFAAFVAWAMLGLGLPYWLAFVAAIGVAFAAGYAAYALLVRRIERHGEFARIGVAIGLFLILDNLAGWVWGYDVHDFPSPFPRAPLRVAGIALSWQNLGVIAVTLLLVGLLFALIDRTRPGLGMRAISSNRESSQFVGVRVERMVALSWGLAAAMGAVAGLFIAPVVFLTPFMMAGVVIYALGGAVLGGMTSAGGAVVGGILVGVAEAFVGRYVGFVGNDLKLSVAFLLIMFVLLFRPSGLFGEPQAERV